MTHRKRLERIAYILSMTPLPRLGCDRYRGKWWLTGCVEGDRPLPCTDDCATLPEAIEAVEAWLAPEIDGLPECSICRRRHGMEVVHACE